MDDDFSLLESLLDGETEAAVACAHAERHLERGMLVCVACGSSERLSDGQTYTSHKMYKRVSKNTNISSNLEQKGFDSRVIVISNQIYNVVINENSKRTGNRSSISCACVFQAFKMVGRPVDYAYIYTKFNIKKRSALKGLKIVNAEIAKRKTLDFHKAISTPITPENFIVSYMEELKASDAAISEVLAIYEGIQDYKELNMSRPQSIAAGVIFYWLKKRGMVDAMKIIEQEANLSQLTISKKAKLVAQKIEENLAAAQIGENVQEEKV
jgi:transcription initiation factor TFIIIB Brf1 subunit/transcription initiation factor TFIIB